MGDMTVSEAYAARASEYAEVLGSMDATAAADRVTVSEWARGLTGPVADAGCGPGHWTEFLRRHGCSVSGFDPVPEFVSIARRAFPAAEFRLGDIQDLVEAPSRYGGILAWYCLIHLKPDVVPSALVALHSALRPGGSLLLGFFDSPASDAGVVVGPAGGTADDVVGSGPGDGVVSPDGAASIRVDEASSSGGGSSSGDGASQSGVRQSGVDRRVRTRDGLQDRAEPFDHAVTTAYRWPCDVMLRMLRDAGFVIRSARQRQDPGTRPHADVVAVRPAAAHG